MNLEEAKLKFINAWGTLGSQWGINRTMSQIHALLLVSSAPLSAEDIMEQLNISRGNANMNIRALMDWGLVFKDLKPGDRKEYFFAGKDIWETARKIIYERRKREIEPILAIVNELKIQSIEGKEKEVKTFNETIENINNFTDKASSIADKFIKSDENWFYKTLINILK